MIEIALWASVFGDENLLSELHIRDSSEEELLNVLSGLSWFEIIVDLDMISTQSAAS